MIVRVKPGGAVKPGLWKLLLSVQDSPHYPPYLNDVAGCPEPLWHCGQHGWSGGNGSCLEGAIVDRLYELESDPIEAVDLFATEPAVVSLLRERLAVARGGGVVPFCGGCTRPFWRSEPGSSVGYWGVMCCGNAGRAEAAAREGGGISPWV